MNRRCVREWLAACFGGWLLGFFVLACLPAEARPLPSLGESDGMSLGDERHIGDHIVSRLYRDPAYIDDPVVQEYVEGIWERLVAAAVQTGAMGDSLDERFAWKVLLGKDRSINAFALPGGYFGLHLGLINVTDTPDELASVMAHELSHVTQRHISRMMAQNARQTPLVIASALLGALAASQSADAGQAMMIGGQALAMQKQLNFSRTMEQEADRMGMALMRPAGFDPVGFVGMFMKLSKAGNLNERSDYPYLRTHPLTTERMADMQARVPEGRRFVAREPTLEHAMVRGRSRVLSLGGPDFLRSAVQGAKVAESGTGDDMPLWERVDRLYMGAMAAAQMRDFRQAAVWSGSVLELTAQDARAHRLAVLLDMALALSSEEDPWIQRASQRLDRQTLARPELFLRTAYVVGNHGSDETLAGQWQRWLAAHPDDGGAWQQLGLLWSAQDQPLRAIRAQAEARAAQLDYDGAIDRLKAGQDMVRRMGPKVDHIDASIMHSRLSAMEQIRRDRDARKGGLK